MTYPQSVLTGKLNDAWVKIFEMHRSDRRTLDLTFGRGLLWEGSKLPENLTSVDCNEGAQIKADLFTLADTVPELCNSFGLVVYDPPYFFEADDQGDPRAGVYGNLSQTPGSFERYVSALETVIPRFLTTSGKVILKCSDQFHLSSRKFLCLHFTWMKAMLVKFDIVDFYVYAHHHASPTAWQVKNRPCCVIMHSYFIVGELR